MSISKDGGIVTVVQIFQYLFTNVLEDFLVGDSGAFGLIKGPIASMETKLLFRELFILLINFPDIESLTIHINDEFLMGVDFVLLERTYSYYDLDTVSFAGHVMKCFG